MATEAVFFFFFSFVAHQLLFLLNSPMSSHVWEELEVCGPRFLEGAGGDEWTQLAAVAAWV